MSYIYQQRCAFPVVSKVFDLQNATHHIPFLCSKYSVVFQESWVDHSTRISLRLKQRPFMTNRTICSYPLPLEVRKLDRL